MWNQLSGPLGQQLTLVLLHFLWQGTLLAALVAMFLSLLRTPQKRYLASVLAMVAMAALPIVTFFVLDRPGSAGATGSIVLSSDAATNASARVIDSAAPGGDAAADWSGHDPPLKSLLTAWSARLQPMVLAGWLTGVFLLSSRLLSGWLGTLWLRGGRVALTGDLPQRIHLLARKLGLNPQDRVFSSARVQEAIVVGLWRPVVLVPLAWFTELPAEVLEAVIAHELAHIRRHDLWVTWLQRILESALFFHPAVWWVSRRIALEREMCCDELAVQATGRPVSYARALEAIGQRFAADQAVLLATSFHGESEMNLLARVRRVLGQQPQPETRSAGLAGFVLIAVGLSVALLLASSGRASQADEEKQERERPAAETGRERSPEAEAGRRRSAEAEEGVRPSAEAEAGVRRSAEGERKVRRSAEAEEGERRERPERDAPEGRERRKEGAPKEAVEGNEGGGRKVLNALRDFEPQNDREAALVGVIKDLQEQLNDLRREVSQLRGKERPRDGEAPRKIGPRDGEGPRKIGPRDGEDLPKIKIGPRDGVGPRNPGPRDGEDLPKIGPRDGEGPAKPGPRDGEGPRKLGPRDGEGPADLKPREPDAA